MPTTLFKKPNGLTDKKFHYCPGCGHGIVHRLIAECVDEMGDTNNTIICAPVGCAVFIPNYFVYDSIHCAHGRAPATATGIKRTHPDKTVITYQGDGDLASIGMAEIIHAAARGEKFTTVFINNGIYGMTGGQMAPTTLPGMKSTTSQSGRDPKLNGNPIRICELLATLTGPAYIERVAVDSPAHVIRAKAAIKKALQYQKEKLGFSLVEVVSSCPTNWGKTAVKAMEFVKTDMIPYYPLGVYKDIKEGK
ncbi:MAG: thiamine pyrophosphate-dependent enzyme [Clostridia bacterium]|jgi:2-oxoglutarate ferredoxin oxidoreductase subunit beta|nr:thiamine pyrophosphate-dependent enzyme [Clostridia bacterium]MCI2001178.1 thiamine pyrophosphate-dependent enzyme [Clostridia bacterium]MCI2015868.1 thiamine pyrophosphate-dependent enzyme [Clostridia bacterium]